MTFWSGFLKKQPHWRGSRLCPNKSFLKQTSQEESCMCRSDEVRSGTRTTFWRQCYKPFRVDQQVKKTVAPWEMVWKEGCASCYEGELLGSLQGSPSLGYEAELGSLQYMTQLGTHMAFLLTMWRTGKQWPKGQGYCPTPHPHPHPCTVICKGFQQTIPWQTLSGSLSSLLSWLPESQAAISWASIGASWVSFEASLALLRRFLQGLSIYSCLPRYRQHACTLGGQM